MKFILGLLGLVLSLGWIVLYLYFLDHEENYRQILRILGLVGHIALGGLIFIWIIDPKYFKSKR